MENHLLRLATVMSDSGLTQTQREVVIQTYHLVGQHAADLAVSFYIKFNQREVSEPSTDLQPFQ